MKAIRALAVLTLVGATFGLAAPASAAGNDATVSALHGVPGATVDVYANSKPLLTDFKPGTPVPAARPSSRPRASQSRPGPTSPSWLT